MNADAKTHADVIQWVVKFYTPPDWNAEKTAGYVAKLARYPLPVLAATASKLIETSAWMPRLSEWLDACRLLYNRALEIEASRRVLLEHKPDSLDVREAVKEAASEGVEFAQALAKKWAKDG